MAYNWSSIPCCEEHGTRRENWPNTFFEGIVTVRVKWNQRWSLVNDIRSNKRKYLDQEDMYLTNALIVPAPGKAEDFDGQQEVYEDALVTLTYSNKKGSGYTESVEPDSENMRLDAGKFEWRTTDETDPDNPIPMGTGTALTPYEAPFLTLRVYTYSITRYNERFIPSQFFDLIGTTNAAEYNCYSLGEPADPVNDPDGAIEPKKIKPQCMMYMPGSCSRTTIPAEQGAPTQGWDYTVRYKVREFSWNKFPRYGAPPQGPPDKPESYYWYMIDKSDPTKVFLPYPPVDHTTLLLPQTAPPPFWALSKAEQKNVRDKMRKF